MLKPILITTKHRGVFVGKVAQDKDLTEKTMTDIQDGRMVIKWRNQKGVQGIAADGPADCKLSATTNIPVLHDVTGVFEVSPEAAAQIWSTNE